MTKDEKAYAIIAGNQVLYFTVQGYIKEEEFAKRLIPPEDAWQIAFLIEEIAKAGKSVVAPVVNPQTLEVEENHLVSLYPGPGTLLNIRPWCEFVEFARAAQKEAERRAAEQKRAEEARKRQENALMQQIMSGSPSVQPPILIPRPIPGKRR